MVTNFPRFIFIPVLSLLAGAAKYEDFQRSNFYTNEQESAVESNKVNQPIQKSPPVEYNQNIVHKNVVKYSEAQQAPYQPRRYESLVGNQNVVPKSDQLTRSMETRSVYRRPADEGRIYVGQPRVRLNEQRDDNRRMRLIRKSAVDQSNWKWGFKRKQKAERLYKEPPYGNGNHLYKPKEPVYSRNPSNDAMVANGHFNSDNMDVEIGFPRHGSVQNTQKINEVKSVKDHRHYFMPQQQQDNFNSHIHKGEASPKANAPARLHHSLGQSPSFEYHDNSQRVDYPQRAAHWSNENPSIYNIPKNEAKNSFPSPPTLDHNVENNVEGPVHQQGNLEVGQMESMKIEMPDVPKSEIQQMNEKKNEVRMEQKIDGPRMEESQPEVAPKVDARYENRRGEELPRVDNEQPNYKYDNVNPRVDNTKLEVCQRAESVQRIERPAIGSGWGDDGRIANAQRLKSSYPNANGLQRPELRHDAALPRPNSAGRPSQNEEIRYLVFNPAEFNPRTLRAALGETARSQGIPFCTLDEYRVESANLQAKAYDLQDKHLQYRGKGSPDFRSRLRHLKETRAKSKGIRSVTKTARQIEIRCITTATPLDYQEGIVFQSQQIDDPCVTECNYECLTRSTCTPYKDCPTRPSFHIMQLRQKYPIISHFENTIEPTINLLAGGIRGHERAKTNSTRNSFPGQINGVMKRDVDVNLLSNIVKELMTSTEELPTKPSPTIGVVEKRIIEKYLGSIVDAQSNRSKNSERTQFQGSPWLEKLLQELANVKIRSRMRDS